MSDTQEYCCASGVCCDYDKRRKALAKLLTEHTSTSHEDAREIADFIHDSFDLLPKAAGLEDVVKYIQAHPYRS